MIDFEQLQVAVHGVLVMAFEDIMDHRERERPIECVGLVCQDGTIYPLINQARSPKRFEVSPKQSLEAVGAIKSRDRDALGMYHSHIERNSSPSERDVLWMRENPMSLSIIAGRDGVAAWMLMENEVRFVASVQEV